MHAQLCRLPIPGSWADVRRLHYHCRKAAGRLDEVRRALMAHENEDAMQAMLLDELHRIRAAASEGGAEEEVCNSIRMTFT